MARKTSGTLFTRGKERRYYLRYCLEGKEHKAALKDELGQPITRKADARIAASKLLAPIVARDTAQRFRGVLAEMQAAETKAEVAEKNLKNARATLAGGWNLFLECPKRPASCKRYPADEIPPHTTAANYAAYYRQFVGWMRDNKSEARLLSDVTPAMAAAFTDVIRRGRAPGTVNKILQFLNCFFNTLAEAGKITAENPFQNIDRAECSYNSKKPLTVEQIAALIDTTDGDMRLLFALGYFTGLRLGDCCTLQWREIDLVRGVIERIPRKTAHTVKDTAQAIVKIGIAALPLELLSAIPEAERGTYLLPRFAEKYLAGGSQQITKWVLKHFEACGIALHRPGTGIKTTIDPKTGEQKKTGCRAVVEIGFHSLRYSYISHSAEAGTPAAIIQRNAGHANPMMTERYTRISDRAAVEYASALRLPTMRPAIDVQPLPEMTPRSELATLLDRLSIEQARGVLGFIRSEFGIPEDKK